jgi:hypothetical protein
MCGEYYFASAEPSFALDVRAKDLSSMIDTLELGELPACVLGNAPLGDATFILHGADVGATFEGPVFYEGPAPGTELMFGAPGAVSQSTEPVQLGIGFDTDFLIEPEAGSEFWASVPDIGLGALREGQGGPLVLASAIVFAAPFDGTTAAMLETLVGVPVAAEERCTYAIDALDGTPMPLWDVVFQTDPPQRVQSGTVGTIELDGREYDVWAWGQDYVSFTIYSR